MSDAMKRGGIFCLEMVSFCSLLYHGLHLTLFLLVETQSRDVSYVDRVRQ